MTREQLDEHIRRMVAEWPPLTPEQEACLWLLFHSGPRPDTTPVSDERQRAA